MRRNKSTATSAVSPISPRMLKLNREGERSVSTVGCLLLRWNENFSAGGIDRESVLIAKNLRRRPEAWRPSLGQRYRGRPIAGAAAAARPAGAAVCGTSAKARL